MKSATPSIQPLSSSGPLNGRLNALGQEQPGLFLSAIRHFKGMEAAIATVNEQIEPTQRPQAFALLAFLGY